MNKKKKKEDLILLKQKLYLKSHCISKFYKEKKMEPSVVVDTSDNTFPFLIGVCSILGTVLAIGMGIAPL